MLQGRGCYIRSLGEVPRPTFLSPDDFCTVHILAFMCMHDDGFAGTPLEVLELKRGTMMTWIAIDCDSHLARNASFLVGVSFSLAACCGFDLCHKYIMYLY